MWPLNINNFTLEDRNQISSFIIDSNNRWTQDIQVKNFEKKIAKYIDVKYAVFVSSGSAANTMLAQYTKDKFYNDLCKTIVFPSTTWQTSCSPWIREGFIPKFIDIDLTNFCINKIKLEEYVKYNYKSIACIFPTSLIGFVPDIDFFVYIQDKYNVKIMLDNCENTLGTFNKKNISSFFTSTTSTYFGHQIQSIEGGFVFTNNILEYEYFLMLRNHGMTRSLSSYNLDETKYTNKYVNPSFDFYCLGNNYRNTDINAFIGQLDLARVDTYKNIRRLLYNLYFNLLDKNKFYLPPLSLEKNHIENVAFCLPIIAYDYNKKEKAIKLCQELNIEYRPIISGFLGYQTCYQKFFDRKKDKEYNNSIFIHKNGLYIGLHAGLTEQMIIDFVEQLNRV